MIVSNNIKNPFKISKILIDNFDVTNNFESLTIEESLFNHFIFGTLLLSRLILDVPKEWTKKELGFLYKELEIELTSDIDEEKREYKKSITFKIYGINKNEKDTISLLFIQEPAFNFYSKQFCDGWEDTNINSIISDIFSRYVESEISISSTPNKTSFTNPLFWTPNKACKYLLPMMGGNKLSYLLFSSSKEEGKTYCLSINDFLESNEETESLVYVIKDMIEKIEIEQSISEIISFNLNHINNNIFNQLINNILGTKVKEYDIESKTILTTNINNNIKNNLKQFGKNTGLVEDFPSTYRNKFYFSNLNGIEIEKNEAIYEYIKTNYIEIIIYGNSKRNLGDLVNIDLSYTNQFLTDPRNEFNGKCIISKIIHTFDRNNYIQKLNCFKTGLDDWEERIATMHN
jgi:hypothetical protein